ncbi:MAG: elongation factor Ts [Clostridiales bacterium]|nr:elongation factor Ts [Clostridiales bacterium]
MAFTAKDVKDLREKTGCGMMDCKKALTESDGDMEKALDYLREKGLAAAQKKSGRIAAEGIVSAYVDEAKKVGVVIEVNSETDFVAKNKDFQEFVMACAKTIAEGNPADVEALAELTISGGDMTVAAALQDKILTIGENLKIRRFVRYEGDVATYIHGGGRIGVMVKFNVEGVDVNSDVFKGMAKDVAMQIAAVNPLYLDRDAVPAEVLEHEKKILTEQVMNEGKPAAIAEKIVMGKLGKYYKDFCLVDQVFVKDSSMNVSQFIAETAKTLGGKISVVEYARFEKGEGLQKREDNFADEVAGMIK